MRAFSERGRQGYDGLSPYGAYLRGILKNLVVDDFRKRKAALSAFGVVVDGGDKDAIDDVAAPAASADVTLQKKQVNDSVRGFLSTLNEREKRFVELRYTKGLKQEDVAARMNVGRSTVRTLEERVRGKLHGQLAVDGLVDDAPRPSVLARAKGWFMPAVLVAFGGSHV